MVGGNDYENASLQPGDQRPPPAGFGLQAVHPRDRAQPGDLAQHQLRVEREDLQGPALEARVLRRPQLQRRVLRQLQPRRRDASTPTTRSTPSSRWAGRTAASRVAVGAPPSAVAPSGSPTPPMRWASRPTSRPTRRWSSARSTRASPRSRWPTPTRRSPPTASASAATSTPARARTAHPRTWAPSRSTRSRRPERRHRRREPAARRSASSPESVATTMKTILHENILGGTGEARPVQRQHRVGQDRHHREQRRRLVLRRDDHFTACVWVGHADSNPPMTTDYNGGPVDGGTYPAEIWGRIMAAIENIYQSTRPRRTTRATRARPPATGTYTTLVLLLLVLRLLVRRRRRWRWDGGGGGGGGQAEAATPERPPEAAAAAAAAAAPPAAPVGPAEPVSRRQPR